MLGFELHRRGEEVTYFKGRHECDFILSRERRPAEAIQVCWELSNRNEKRELARLSEAARTLGLKQLPILTFDQRDTVEAGDVATRVLPVWEWMLTPVADGIADDIQEA